MTVDCYCSHELQAHNWPRCRQPSTFRMAYVVVSKSRDTLRARPYLGFRTSPDSSSYLEYTLAQNHKRSTLLTDEGREIVSIETVLCRRETQTNSCGTRFCKLRKLI